jgi:hypothetical protein
MTTFDDRERQFETKYAHDQEMRFKMTVRRNRLLGEWAAGQMAMTGTAAADYARTVVESDFQKPGDGDVIEKVIGDLTAHGVKADERSIRAKLEECARTAKVQLMSE